MSNGTVKKNPKYLSSTTKAYGKCVTVLLLPFLVIMILYAYVIVMICFKKTKSHSDNIFQ